ncbi:MAG: hypothetical protein J6A59_13035 [Lachnospiraceae bacterium]|nr:hypothetical protein [Lachnospiraceae bacterium]
MAGVITSSSEKILGIENQIIAGDHSNKTTMMYFANLANYYYLGGKTKLPIKIKRVLNRDWLSTQKAKYNYIRNAEIYILGGWIYLKTKDVIAKRSITNTKGIVNGLKTTLNNWGIDVELDNSINKITFTDNYKLGLKEIILVRDIINDNVAKNIANEVVKLRSEKLKNLDDTYYKILDTL